MSEQDEHLKKFVSGHLQAIDTAGHTGAADVNGMPIVVFTITVAKTGQPRRVPLMKVEQNGTYAAVASKGGAEKDPIWVNSIRINPQVIVHDGSDTHRATAREITDKAEREKWWKIAVEAFPPYIDYQKNTSREIPVFLIEPTE